MALQQLAVDGHGLVALAHDGVNDGHVTLIILVAGAAAHGFLQQRHHRQRPLNRRFVLYFMERTGKQLLGDGGDGVARSAAYSRGGDALPVVVAQPAHLYLTQEIEYAKRINLLGERHGGIKDAAQRPVYSLT